MKKTYINPELETIEITTVGMLAVSDPPVDSNSEPVNPGTGADAPSFDFEF